MRSARPRHGSVWVLTSSTVGWTQPQCASQSHRSALGFSVDVRTARRVGRSALSSTCPCGRVECALHAEAEVRYRVRVRLGLRHELRQRALPRAHTRADVRALACSDRRTYSSVTVEWVPLWAQQSTATQHSSAFLRRGCSQCGFGCGTKHSMRACAQRGNGCAGCRRRCRAIAIR